MCNAGPATGIEGSHGGVQSHAQQAELGIKEQRTQALRAVVDGEEEIAANVGMVAQAGTQRKRQIISSG